MKGLGLGLGVGFFNESESLKWFWPPPTPCKVSARWVKAEKLCVFLSLCLGPARIEDDLAANTKRHLSRDQPPREVTDRRKLIPLPLPIKSLHVRSKHDPRTGFLSSSKQ